MFEIIVDYFTGDNTFQVMLYNKSTDDTVGDNIEQGLNFNEMVEEVTNLKSVYSKQNNHIYGGHVAEVTFNTFDIDENPMESMVSSLK